MGPRGPSPGAARVAHTSSILEKKHPMSDAAVKEARKALARLRRALEKGRRELDALAGAIRHAEGEDFPQEAYQEVEDRMVQILDFLEEEGHRLEAKVLEFGGLEPGRVRRSS